MSQVVHGADYPCDLCRAGDTRSDGLLSRGAHSSPKFAEGFAGHGGGYLLRIPRGVRRNWPRELIEAHKVFWPLGDWPELSWTILLRAHFADTREYFAPAHQFVEIHTDYRIYSLGLLRLFSGYRVEMSLKEALDDLERGNAHNLTSLSSFMKFRFESIEFELDELMDELEEVSCMCYMPPVLSIL